MSHTTTVESAGISSVKALKATVKALQKQGIECELLENTKPRMYYDDQLQRQMGRSSEICPYVLRLKDAAYDVAFIEDEKDASRLMPVFDDWVPPGRKGVKDILGAQYEGKVEHWAGRKSASEQQLHSIGKLLQEHSAVVSIDQMKKKGFRVAKRTTDKKGHVQLQFVSQ